MEYGFATQTGEHVSLLKPFFNSKQMSSITVNSLSDEDLEVVLELLRVTGIPSSRIHVTTNTSPSSAGAASRRAISPPRRAVSPVRAAAGGAGVRPASPARASPANAERVLTRDATGVVLRNVRWKVTENPMVTDDLSADRDLFTDITLTEEELDCVISRTDVTLSCRVSEYRGTIKIAGPVTVRKLLDGIFQHFNSPASDSDFASETSAWRGRDPTRAQLLGGKVNFKGILPRSLTRNFFDLLLE